MVGLTKKREEELPAEKPGVTTSTGLQVLPLAPHSPPVPLPVRPSSNMRSWSELSVCFYCLAICRSDVCCTSPFLLLADHVVMLCALLLQSAWISVMTFSVPTFCLQRACTDQWNACGQIWWWECTAAS